MGGCSSNVREEVIKSNYFDLNEDHTKNFEKGEVYYTFNKEEK